MSGYVMAFPDTWEEYEEDYGFTDTEQIYTNGSRLIQSFRVKQWLEHIEVSDGEWVEDEYGISRCRECNCINNTVYRNYCPNCGARMGVISNDKTKV